MTEPPLTVDQFLDARYDLPDSGQWAELDVGRVTLFQPPDLDHGNTILNLSKAIAAWAADAEGAYACFDLGLILRRDPDTVRFPAVSFFSGGERFAEADKLATEAVPDLVVELASSADRREIMSQRVADYLHWGAGGVWVIQPKDRYVEVVDRTGAAIRLDPAMVLEGGLSLPGFSLNVSDLFAEPDWWTRPARKR
jgi:Uma2 family endonuclease